ncbi:MAG TPA: serine protease [Candidatus Aquilonibacter sp.]|nr:serine protease [Candidatus Aquilonibacter sp.]
MKTRICLLGIFAFVAFAIAAPRTWILKTGETVTGNYFSSGTTAVVIKVGGTNCILKISDLSSNDQTFVKSIQMQKEKNDAAFREARKKFIEEYEPLRVINGELYDFSVLYQLTSDGTWSDDDIANVFDDWTVHGKVIQVLNDGLLVEESRLDQAVFLKNYRHQDAVVDDTPITAFALLSGRYTYENTAGAENTIFAFDCGRTYNPNSDTFSNKTVLTYRKVGEYTYAPEKISLPVYDYDKFAPENQELSRVSTLNNTSESNSSASKQDIADSDPAVTGTGFFITDDGYLISNYHVVKDATKIRLLTSAGLIDAKVVQVDEANDLALLKADGKFSPLPISSSRSAQLGGTVATVGFPDIGLQGFAPKLAKGEIASLSGAEDDPRYFQISVPVQPGNSGGALVDERGNVIGIVSAKLDAASALAASGALPENVNYAVKSSLLLSFLESVPDVDAKLKAPNTADEKFEDVVKSAQDAAVLVLVY